MNSIRRRIQSVGNGDFTGSKNADSDFSNEGTDAQQQQPPMSSRPGLLAALRITPSTMRRPKSRPESSIDKIPSVTNDELPTDDFPWSMSTIEKLQVSVNSCMSSWI